MLLQGLRVLDLGRYISAPFCATVLGDYGAEVIRLESPGGAEDREQGPHAQSGDNLRFLMLSRNKKGVSLDLQQPGGRELFLGLAERSDVVVENYSPEVKRRLGITYEDLAQVNPRIILTSISGFGDDGPYSHRLGFEQIIQAESGAMSLNGYPDTPPVRSQVPWVDFGTGLYAAIGTILALKQREQTGRGQQVDAALWDTAISYLGFMGVPAEYRLLGLLRPQLGNAGFYTFTDLFFAQDGAVLIAAASNPIWRRVAHLIGRPDLLEDSRFQSDATRYEHRHLICQAVQAWVSQHTLEEVTQAAWEARVPCGRVRTMAELADDPQVQARDMLTDVDVPQAGPVLHPRLGIRLSQAPTQIRTPAPGVGEHNEEVYTQLLGLSPEELADFRRQGVI